MMGSIKTKMDERSIIILWSHKQLHRAHRTALLAQKMNFFYVLTVLFAGIATANAACDPADSCKYDCPLIGKDFYGSDISCGYNLAQDWKACCKDWINERNVLKVKANPVLTFDVFSKAARCNMFDACTHWTWLIDSVGKKCCLKTSDSGIRNLIWPGASGEKNCKGAWRIQQNSHPR